MVRVSEQIEPDEFSRETRPEGNIPDNLAAAIVTGAGEFMLFLGFIAAALVIGGEGGWGFPAAVLALSTVRTGILSARGLPARFRSRGRRRAGGGHGMGAVLCGRWVMILVMLLLLIVIMPEGSLL